MGNNINEAPKSSTSGGAQAATRSRGKVRHHGELLAGDTFVWSGLLLRVEAGGIAMGMPVRELTLRVSEPTAKANPDPRCSVCNGKCRWVEDAWVCTKCGAEWYPDHGPQFEVPE